MSSLTEADDGVDEDGSDDTAILESKDTERELATGSKRDGTLLLEQIGKDADSCRRLTFRCDKVRLSLSLKSTKAWWIAVYPEVVAPSKLFVNTHTTYYRLSLF